MDSQLKKEYLNFNKTHPLGTGRAFDRYGFPKIKREDFSLEDFEDINVVNFKNIKNAPNKKQSIVLMFNDDKVLNSLWDNPFNPLINLSGFLAVCSPDFSVYDTMNVNEIRYNVFRNRWYACFLQEKGIKVIPTIQWATPKTYHICFSSLPKHSIVAISTLGCKKTSSKFLSGYKEMMRRLRPALVICFGGLIKGMFGRIIQFDYSDSFNKNNLKYEQLKLFHYSKILQITKEES